MTGFKGLSAAETGEALRQYIPALAPNRLERAAQAQNWLDDAQNKAMVQSIITNTGTTLAGTASPSYTLATNLTPAVSYTASSLVHK